MSATRDQINQTIAAIQIVASAIQEVGEVPSGHLYAALMGKLTINDYNYIIDTLKGAGVVEEKYHLLKWIGPARKEASNASGN